jgi:pyridoxine 5-phosphate synthase
MSATLSVNLNKIALLRNSREGNNPSVIEFGEMCISAGCQGLTVHPRPDLRHIRPQDVMELSTLVNSYNNQAYGGQVEFNIEGNPFAETSSNANYPGFIALVEQARPHQATLVPDNEQQLTSDHGFNLTVMSNSLSPIIEQLQRWNIRVSLFMEPDIEQIKLAHDLGVDRIELYTGPYAHAYCQSTKDLDAVYQRYYQAAIAAQKLGLGVNAGHDLNLKNLGWFLQIPGIKEVSIGHGLIIDALKMGYSSALNHYLAICSSSI